MKTIFGVLGMSFTFIFIFISSCKKDSNNSDPLPPAYANYSELKAGNYWIYQEFTVDSNGNAIATPAFDSCYVEKDTLFNGKTYYKMYRNDPYAFSAYNFIRDSLHYIVNLSGEILFSSVDTTTTFNSAYLFTGTPDSILKTTEMDDINEITVVPAGNFKTRNFRETYFSPSGFFHPNPKIRNTKYAENVGIVVETQMFFSSDPTYTERRLVRYHVQ